MRKWGKIVLTIEVEDEATFSGIFFADFFKTAILFLSAATPFFGGIEDERDNEERREKTVERRAESEGIRERKKTESSNRFHN